MIPPQLQNSRFCKLNKHQKIPFEKQWNTITYSSDDVTLLTWVAKGNNYGVVAGYNNLLIIDFDSKEVQEKVLPLLPPTFTVKTAGKGLYHLYYYTDDTTSWKIMDAMKNTLADILSEGKQAVGPGSCIENGNKYTVVNNIPIAECKIAIIKDAFKEWLPVTKEKPINTTPTKKDDVVDKIKSTVSISSVLSKAGINVHKNPTECPLHSSKGGQCLSFDDSKGLWKCFHCDKGGDVFNLYMLVNNCDFVKAKADLNPDLGTSSSPKSESKSPADEAGEIFTRIGQAKEYIKKQPFYYSPEGLFWVWNSTRFCYEIKDEIDLLNGIRHSMFVDTIESKSKNEIISALKQVGRENKPIKKDKTWVQFKDLIVNPKTLQSMKASSEYFLTNPIPHSMGKSDQTPEIDRLFKEWVVQEGLQDETYVASLQEICAYCLTNHKFMQRLFALTGGGSNGKGTFLNLIETLIGSDNCVSVDIKKLSENNFAMSAIYKRLAGFAGEVSYGDLSNTNSIKRLTGEDSIDYEFKGKNSFTDKCETTFIIATNSLPATPDKTLGFYRRWQIIDFPNTFEIKSDLLKNITESEYENFCFKCVKVLQRLYLTNKFTNEGGYEEREEKYEEHSNPLLKFIETCCDEVAGEKIKQLDFTNKFNEWARQKKFRPLTVHQVGKILRDNGFETGKRKEGENSYSAVLNIVIKPSVPKTTITTTSQSQIACKKSISTFGSFGSSGTGIFESGKYTVFCDVIMDVITKKSVEDLKRQHFPALTDEEYKMFLAKAKTEGICFEPEPGFIMRL